MDNCGKSGANTCRPEMGGGTLLLGQNQKFPSPRGKRFKSILNNFVPIARPWRRRHVIQMSDLSTFEGGCYKSSLQFSNTFLPFLLSFLAPLFPMMDLNRYSHGCFTYSVFRLQFLPRFPPCVKMTT